MLPFHRFRPHSLLLRLLHRRDARRNLHMLPRHSTPHAMPHLTRVLKKKRKPFFCGAENAPSPIITSTSPKYSTTNVVAAASPTSIATATQNSLDHCLDVHRIMLSVLSEVRPVHERQQPRRAPRQSFHAMHALHARPTLAPSQ
jgi:hypothetical protein